MSDQLDVGGITINVVFKDIKNVHLSVYPPDGRVRIAAPTRMSLDALRLYAIAKIDWIKQQQKKLHDQERETPREYLDRESHHVWGRRYLLKVIEADLPPIVQLKHSTLLLQVRPGSNEQKKQEILETWFREQLKPALVPLIANWEPRLGVHVAHFFVQRMKTRWGSCNPATRSIRVNTELAKKPPECLEYIVIHEMAHLLEPTHNHHFIALMDDFLPRWKFIRDELNHAPLSHQDWKY